MPVHSIQENTCQKSIKTAAEVIDVLHENYTRLLEGGVHFGRRSRNIMLSGTFVQRTPAVEDLITFVTP